MFGKLHALVPLFSPDHYTNPQPKQVLGLTPSPGFATAQPADLSSVVIREYVEILDRDELARIRETKTADERRYGNELDEKFRGEVHRLVDIGWKKIPPGTLIGGSQINVHFESPETKVTIDSRTKNHFIIYYNAKDQNRAKTFKVTKKGKILVSHYREDKKKQRFTRATRFETNEITNRLHDLKERHYTS